MINIPEPKIMKQSKREHKRSMTESLKDKMNLI